MTLLLTVSLPVAGLLGLTGPSSALAAAADPVDAVIAANTAPRDPKSDHSWNDEDVVGIQLEGTTAQAESDSVTVSRGQVTITAAGTYRVTGTLTEGQLVVAAGSDDLVRVILDGASITDSGSAPLLVDSAARVLLNLPTGTRSVLNDHRDPPAPGAAASKAKDSPEAALYSRADLTVDGAGSLTVAGEFQDAITSTHGVVVDGGQLTLNGARDGLHGKEYVAITGGSVGVTAGRDGVKATEKKDTALGYVLLTGGTLNVTATGDAVSAATDGIVDGGTATLKAGGGNTATVAAGDSAKGIKGNVTVAMGGGTVTVDAAENGFDSKQAVVVSGGTLKVSTGNDGLHSDNLLTVTGGSITVPKAYEGLQGITITISGGSFDLTTADDGINAADDSPPDSNSKAVSLTISGGTLIVNSQSDSLDANGVMTITGGLIVISGPTGNSDGVIDANGSLTITGGTVIGVGYMGLGGSSPKNSQGWAKYSFRSQQKAGTIVHLTTADGEELAAFASPKSFKDLFVSLPTIVNGSKYQVLTGGSVSGDHTAWYYPKGDPSEATLAGTVTAGKGGFGA